MYKSVLEGTLLLPKENYEVLCAKCSKAVDSWEGDYSMKFVIISAWCHGSASVIREHSSSKPKSGTFTAFTVKRKNDP